MAAREPVPGTYQHYKGGFYEVLGIADEPEGGGRFVVYESLGITENLLDDDEAGPRLGHRVVRNGTKGALAVCTVARFTEAGVEIRWDERIPGTRRFHASDPVGNRLEFIAPKAG